MVSICSILCIPNYSAGMTVMAQKLVPALAPRRKLSELGQKELFSEFAQHGFFSSVSDVESSASS